MIAYNARVNRQLASVNALLVTLDNEEKYSPALARILLESTLYHFNSAFICHLRAIAANYSASDIDSITDSATLISALTRINCQAPEAREISTLFEESWLGDFSSALAELSSPLNPALGRGDITLVDSQCSAAILNFSKVKYWLSQFNELVLRQREMMVEY